MPAPEDRDPAKVFRLTEPLMIGDQPIEELYLDFDSITPTQYLDVGQRYLKLKDASALKQFDERYHVMLAAQVAGVPYHPLLKIKGADFIEIARRAQVFLMNAGSRPSDQNGETPDETE